MGVNTPVLLPAFVVNENSLDSQSCAIIGLLETRNMLIFIALFQYELERKKSFLGCTDYRGFRTCLQTIKWPNFIVFQLGSHFYKMSSVCQFQCQTKECNHSKGVTEAQVCKMSQLRPGIIQTMMLIKPFESSKNNTFVNGSKEKQIKEPILSTFRR